MKIILITLSALFVFNSCNSGKVKKQIDENNFKMDIVKNIYLGKIKNAKQLKIYCWCFGQSPNFKGCITEMGMSAQYVINKGQVIYSTDNKNLIDSIILNFLDKDKIIGVSKNIGDARIVLKFDNPDSSYFTINFTEHNNSYIIYNDSLLIKLDFDPTIFLNKITGLKNIECEAN